MAEYDLLIKNGTIVDGTRMPAYRGDIGIRKGRIVAMGNLTESASKTIDATEAERIGLITYVAPPGGALAIARDIATDIMTKPPLAVKWAKAAVNQQLFMMFHLNMRLGIASEALTFLSDDHKEAVHSIVDKRSPDYDGR